eukprot:4085286-Prorocentrum_lima.AAC.1
MTSSLVGSEMCIRDRSLRVARMNPEFAKKLVLLRARQELVEGRPGEVAACLLYTSDAADDM